jgi:hypothetical protein
MKGYSLDESEIDDETAAFSVIKFGDLFKMYTRISDKVAIIQKVTNIGLQIFVISHTYL